MSVVTQSSKAAVISKLSPRERVIRALNHQPVDRVPVDFGGTVLSGAHVSIIAKIRQ